MNITKLNIRNFLAISNAEIDLDKRGLLLIQGVNDDDPSADSNGAGKSSIVDALCWSIYGVTARGVSGDAVVSNAVKKDCSVIVEVEDEGVDYKIMRYRKDTTQKNALLVIQRDSAGIETNLAKGTDRETQEVIDKIMGCSLDVFVAAIYAGQEKMPDLPGMTDKMLKMLIEEAAGVEALSQAYSIARERMNTAKTLFSRLEPEKKSLEEFLKGSTMALNDAEASSLEFESQRKEKAKSELAKTLPLKKAIEEAKRDLAHKESAESILAEMDGVELAMTKQKDEQAKLKTFQAEVTRMSAELARQTAQLRAAKTAISAAEQELKDIDGQVGKPCGECGKTYEKHDLATARLARLDKIKKLHEALEPVERQFNEAKVAYKNAQDAANDFERSMTDFTTMAAKYRTLSGALNDVRKVEQTIERLTGEIHALGESAKAKLSEQNAWLKLIETHSKEIERINEKLKEVYASIEKEGADLEMLENAVKVFGPAGVRAHILDTVTPFLNDRTQEYLGALSDGNIHAEWSTLAKTAKGELREKFNIEVTNDNGADSFAGLSGGEKRKARLACAMALQDMVAGRAAKPINIFIADEVDHALDESGLERLMGVLERKARERGTVLVISHNSLADWIDSVITVTKSGKKSTVSGDTIRGV